MVPTLEFLRSVLSYVPFQHLLQLRLVHRIWDKHAKESYIFAFKISLRAYGTLYLDTPEKATSLFLRSITFPGTLPRTLNLTVILDDVNSSRRIVSILVRLLEGLEERIDKIVCIDNQERHPSLVARMLPSLNCTTLELHSNPDCSLPNFFRPEIELGLRQDSHIDHNTIITVSKLVANNILFRNETIGWTRALLTGGYYNDLRDLDLSRVRMDDEQWGLLLPTIHIRALEIARLCILPHDALLIFLRGHHKLYDLFIEGAKSRVLPYQFEKPFVPLRGLVNLLYLDGPADILNALLQSFDFAMKKKVRRLHIRLLSGGGFSDSHFCPKTAFEVLSRFERTILQTLSMDLPLEGFTDYYKHLFDAESFEVNRLQRQLYIEELFIDFVSGTGEVYDVGKTGEVKKHNVVSTNSKPVYELLTAFLVTDG